MSIYQGTTTDSLLNGHLSSIRSAEYGRDARAPMASAVQRCFEIANSHASGSHVNPYVVTEAANSVRSEVYGDNVRNAFITGLRYSYQARGISVPYVQETFFNEVIYAQLGEDLKNGILKSIVRCYQDVS